MAEKNKSSAKFKKDNDKNRDRGAPQGISSSPTEQSRGSINVHTKGGMYDQTPPPAEHAAEQGWGQPTDNLHPKGVQRHPDAEPGSSNYATPPGAPTGKHPYRGSGPESRGSSESAQEATMAKRDNKTESGRSGGENWKVPEGLDRTRDPEHEMPDPEEADRARDEARDIRKQMEKGGKRDKAA